MGPVGALNACTHRVRCQRCALSSQCFPAAVSDQDLEALDRIVLRGPTLSKGSTLFQAGETPVSIFVVRSGALCSYSREACGTEQILGFHLAGDLVGLAASHDERYEVTAQALQITAICELPLAELEAVSARVPAMRRHLLRLLSRDLQHNQKARLLLSVPRAEVRVAMFINHYRARLNGRGLSATRLRFPMSRRELANHLGLAVETLSRSLSNLRAKGFIDIHGKELEIIEPEKLAELAARALSQGR